MQMLGPPLCWSCARWHGHRGRLRGVDALSCDAYPVPDDAPDIDPVQVAAGQDSPGIPAEIYFGLADHRRPFGGEVGDPPLTYLPDPARQAVFDAWQKGAALAASPPGDH
jgi:hypothetical protein